MSEKINTTTGRIFEVIAHKPGASLYDIVEATGLPLTTIRYNVLLLKGNGLVSVVPIKKPGQSGPARMTYYPVKGGKE